MRFSLGAAFIIAGVALGYITAQQALSRAGTQAAEDPHWRQELVNPKDPYAIYAVGHFRAEGRLPPPRGAKLFYRFADDDGRKLRADCAYKISGSELPARWWSVSLAPAGQSVQAASSNAAEVMTTGDGRIELNLSRRALPGNWLAMPEGNELKLTLVLHETGEKDKKGSLILPALIRLSCE